MEEELIYYSLPDQLNLDSTDILFIASDIKKIALDCRSNGILFNPNDLIDSFQKSLSKGTIVVPAYSDYLKNGDTFKQETTKPSTGALSNRVMRRKDFVRSKDPLHSVFAWGKFSKTISTIGSESSLGEGSVFEFLFKNNAKMICIDVDFQNSLTFVHYVEEKLQVNYRKAYQWSFNLQLKGEKERIKKITFYTKKPWVLTDLHQFQRDAIQNGVVKELKLGKSTIYHFQLNEIHQFIEQYIKSKNKLHRISFVELGKNIARKILRKK